MYIQIPKKMERQIIFENIQAQKKTNETHLTKYKEKRYSLFWVYYVCFVCLMVFNVTFNNISVVSWW